MKPLLPLLIVAILCSCRVPPGPVTPKPDIGRVIKANANTQTAIKKTKETQQQLGESQTKVSGSLQGIMDDLNKLLNP
jgi:hypothetical protein